MILRVADFLLRRSLLPGRRGAGIRTDLRLELEEVRSGPFRRLASVWYFFEAVKLSLRFLLFRARRARRVGTGVGLRGPGASFSSGHGPRRINSESKGNLMPTLLHDVRHALRSFRKSPVFFGTVLLIFALGIGANTVMFSVVNGVILNPLPYPGQDRLLIPYQTHPGRRVSDNPIHRAWWDRFAISYPSYEYWLENSPVFDGFGIHMGVTYLSTGEAGTERISGSCATFGVFQALGVEPVLGRTFLPEEDRVGGSRMVILSHGLWVQRFGSDPGVLGQSMILDEERYTIVGVMPEGFYFPDHEKALWTTFSDSDRRMSRNNHFARMVARLKPGITLDAAQREMEGVVERMKELYPIPNRDYGVNLQPLKDEVVRDTRSALLLLLASVGVFLAIACANVAGLLLLRAAERGKEFTVRQSLGAGRGRILSQLLTEGLVLSALGGGLGLLLATVGLRPLVGLLPPGTPRLEEVALDPRVLLFSTVLAVATGILVSVLPGLTVTRAGAGNALRGKGKGTIGGRARNRTQGLLLVSEIALTFMLLVGAGLLGKSFSRLTATDWGFSSQGIFTLQVDVRGSRYDSQAVVRQTYEEFFERLGAIPGVTSVGAASPGPLGANPTRTTTVDTRDGLLPTNTNQEWVTLDYHSTMGVPLLSGRNFMPEEMDGRSGVILVNQALADTYWPGENPLGQRITFGDTTAWLTVIGVAGNSRRRLDSEPYATVTRPLVSMEPIIAVKTEIDPALVMAQAREAVAAVDPNVPIIRMEAVEDAMGRSVAGPRVRTLLLGAFSLFAAALAVVGIFGVLSYAVNQRTNEIGIRMALGAESGEVLAGVLKRGLALLSLGLVLGILLTLITVEWLEPFLFQVSSTDTAILVGVTVLLTLAATGASLFPAFRAARVDPVEALRAE